MRTVLLVENVVDANRCSQLLIDPPVSTYAEYAPTRRAGRIDPDIANIACAKPILPVSERNRGSNGERVVIEAQTRTPV